ncbi:SDR family NAD(P)-dependent oxidoreductase [Paracoccus sp. R86501]|uniref:SDR family NAD(P)-dependent oxidoreductase n=1 Tax=Paracoccus sp. R86501 TaxID=3101711 RepID=UPI0036708282
MRLQGQTAIVTGGGRDIGAACAIKLAAEGANVVINYHASAEGAEKVVAQIKGAGGNAVAVQGDLTDPAQVDKLVQTAVDTFGGLHVLVNNSGGLVARNSLREMDMTHWNKVMELNLTSVFLMTKAAVAQMDKGAIVNIASQAARDGGGAGSAAYAASKGAVMTLTRSLAKELGPDIRVNGLCPGMVDTDFHNIFTPDQARRGFEAAAPVKRQGVPDDIANAVAFLASDDSAFMTGVNIDINGGMLFS